MEITYPTWGKPENHRLESAERDPGYVIVPRNVMVLSGSNRKGLEHPFSKLTIEQCRLVEAGDLKDVRSTVVDVAMFLNHHIFFHVFPRCLISPTWCFFPRCILFTNLVSNIGIKIPIFFAMLNGRRLRKHLIE